MLTFARTPCAKHRAGCATVAALTLCAATLLLTGGHAAPADSNEPNPPAIAPTTQPATSPATQPATQPAFRLADLAWLAGRWEGEVRSGRVEEHWSAPRDGLMLGMFRMTNDDGRILVLELLTLREIDAGVEYRLRHFTATLEPLEAPKQTPTLHLTELTPERVVFTNPDPNEPLPYQPHRYKLYRRAPDRYEFSVTAMRDGEEREIVTGQMRRATAE